MEVTKYIVTVAIPEDATKFNEKDIADWVINAIDAGVGVEVKRAGGDGE